MFRYLALAWNVDATEQCVAALATDRPTDARESKRGVESNKEMVYACSTQISGKARCKSCRSRTSAACSSARCSSAAAMSTD